MPDDRQDDRASEHIEAFIEGPPRIRRKRDAPTGPDQRRPRKDVPLDTRRDWNAALAQEEARGLRYDSPAAVLIVDIGPVPALRVERAAGLVGATVRHHARETDRVARVGPGRFHVLLPETLERDAAVLAERIRRACASTPAIAAIEGATVRTAVASPVRGQGLGEALKIAEARLDS